MDLASLHNQQERRWKRFVLAAAQSKKFDSGYKFTKKSHPAAIVYKMTVQAEDGNHHCLWHCHVLSSDDKRFMPGYVRDALWFLADLCSQIGELARSDKLSFRPRKGKRSFLVDCPEYTQARGTVRRWAVSIGNPKERMFQFPLAGMVSVGCLD